MTVGIVGGFIGVGGGYMVTPALIVFGFPGYMASGIDVTHIAGKSVIATIRHRQLGNIDWVLGLAMVGGTMMGVEMGVRLLNYTKAIGLSGIALLTGSVGIMIGLFLYTQIETHKAQKKINELTKEGKTVGRELRVSKITASVPEHPFEADHSVSYGAAGLSMWVVVIVGICYRSACRVLRRGRRLHSSPGPCLRGWRDNPYRCGNGPSGDSRFRRLWGAEAVHER